MNLSEDNDRYQGDDVRDADQDDDSDSNEDDDSNNDSDSSDENKEYNENEEGDEDEEEIDSNSSSDANSDTDQNNQETSGAPFLDFELKDLCIPQTSKDRITCRDHLLSVIAMSLRHKLDYETILSMFRWTKSSSEYSNLPTNKLSLWNILSRNDDCFVRHLYCGKCKDP